MMFQSFLKSFVRKSLMRNINKRTGAFASWAINKTLKGAFQRRLSALCLHWVKAVYLCLLHPLLDWRPADKRELMGTKAKL